MQNSDCIVGMIQTQFQRNRTWSLKMAPKYVDIHDLKFNDLLTKSVYHQREGRLPVTATVPAHSPFAGCLPPPSLAPHHFSFLH